MKNPCKVSPISRSLLRCSFFILPIVLCCFALVQNTQAQLPPPAPDGGYPGGNTAEGDNALHDVNTAVGINNTAVGSNALQDNTTGAYNVAVGSGALASNTTGSFNMAIGAGALLTSNANFNLAIGYRVGFMNTTGNHLTGIGAAALRNNTTASNNTAIGADALRENTTGEPNTAIGSSALRSNTTVGENTAVGFEALTASQTSFGNVAIGNSALASFTGAGTTTTNGFNTALGSLSLTAETDGQENTAVGRRSLEFLLTGSNNTAIGWRAGDNYTGAESGNVLIGSGVAGVTGEDNTTRISNILGTFQPFSAGVVGFVTVGPGGKLGNGSFSSRRFKDDIKPMDKASEQLFALKPVTFRYKQEFEPTHSPQYGLIAEEVAEVNPNLVIHGEDGKVQGVRYDSINNMLLNEFLKEHKKVQELEATVAQQQKGMEALVATVKEQAALIQKVSAQVEMSKSTPKVVVNNP